MSETVRAVIMGANYEDAFEWEIWVPDPEYMDEQWLRSSWGNMVYDIPVELAEKYDKAIRLRIEVDAKIGEIVVSGQGKYRKNRVG